MAPTGAAAPATVLACFLFVGSSVHVASTACLFTVPSVRRHARGRPARYLCAPAAVIACGTAAAVLLSPHALAWLLLPFFAWQFHHFQKQNLGLVALAASSAESPASPAVSGGASPRRVSSASPG